MDYLLNELLVKRTIRQDQAVKEALPQLTAPSDLDHRASAQGHQHRDIGTEEHFRVALGTIGSTAGTIGKTVRQKHCLLRTF
jgi:hypothetical protein